MGVIYRSRTRTYVLIEPRDLSAAHATFLLLIMYCFAERSRFCCAAAKGSTLMAAACNSSTVRGLMCFFNGLMVVLCCGNNGAAMSL